MPERYASLKQGLVGAWIPSVSGSGFLLPDLSGYGNHGTLTNMAADDWVSAQYGRALDFDGSNDRVVIADNDVFSFVSKPFTISVFAKTSTASDKPIVSKSFAQFSYEWSLTFGNDISIVGWTSGQGANFWGALASGTFADNKWHNVSALYDGGNSWTSFSIYLDGVKQVTTQLGAPTGSLANTTANLFIGAGLIGDIFSAYFNGQLDDIRIYNRALSDSEIRILAQRPGIGLRQDRDRQTFYQFPSGSRRRLLLTGQT